MAKGIKYHFYLKDKNSHEPTPINIAINKDGYRKKMGIGESIHPYWWDNKNECAIEDSRQKKNEKALARRVNKNLNRLRQELDTLFNDYSGIEKLSPNHTEGDDLMVELFDQVAKIISGQIERGKKEDKSSRITPSEFFAQFIEKWSHSPNRRTGITPKGTTVWNYKNTLRRYKDFISDNGLRDSFTLFDENFITEFDTYLTEEQELAMNTIVGSHSQLKTMLREAQNKGYLHDSSYLNWPSKTVNFTKVYLTDAEINMLYHLQISDVQRRENHIGQESHIEESRDIFIISARTGLRFSDLRNLNSATWDLTPQKESITILIQKTTDKLTIPLHQQVIDIYKKYQGHFPSPVDKSKYNKHIRLCAKIAGIDTNISSFNWEKGRPVMGVYKKYELISSHTGRRSFATNLYLICKRPHQVMNLTGHKTEANFKKYICVDQKELAEAARKYINLTPVDEREEGMKEMIEFVQKSTLEIAEKKKTIADLQYWLKWNDVFSQEQIRMLESQIEDLQFALGLGLSSEEYEEAKKQSDEIASIIDSQE